MAKRLLLRDAENISADQLQRLLGDFYWNLPVVGGVGTGYSGGLVGKWLTPSTGHLAITANGSNMVLTMLGGWAAVVRDGGGSTFDPRALFAESDASDTVTITANATGSTRNDTVCLRIDQNSAPTSDGSNLISLVAIAGQSGGGVSNAPADGNLYLPLANVAVANGATSLTQGNVTDLRRQSPTYPNIGGGTIDFVEVNNGPAQGTFTALTDLTNLTRTIQPSIGRRIRLSGYVVLSSSVGTDIVAIALREGATVLQGAQGIVAGAGAFTTLEFEKVLVADGLQHTYKISAERSAGTGNVTHQAGQVAVGITYFSHLLIEDIGV